MQVPPIVAFYREEADVQKFLNELVQSDFDTINVSIIMLDKRREKDMLVPYDEDNIVSEEGEGYGTIWTIDGEYLDATPVSIPDFGRIIVAGPLLDKIDTVGFSNTSEGSLEVKLNESLRTLGIPEAEIDAAKARIKPGNEILIHMPVNEDIKIEIEKLVNDTGGELVF